MPLLVLLGAALVLRAAYLADFFLHDPLATQLVSDAQLYHDWASALASGDAFGAGEPFHHPPLYPFFVAVLYALGGPHPAIVAVVQALIGIANVFLGYALARQVASRGAALATSAVALFYAPFVFFESRLLAESTALACTTAALFLATTRRPAASGLWFGVAAALRPNQLLAIAFVLPFWFAATPRERCARVLGAFLSCAALPIAPFFVANLVRSGEPVLLCDTGGINLWFAHQDDAGVSFRTTDPRFGDVASQPQASRAIAEAHEKRSLSWREVSNHFTGRAIDWALEHPGAELARTAGKGAAFLSNFEYEIVYAPGSETDATPTLRWFCVPASLLLGLGVAGLVFGSRRGSRDRTTIWLFAAFALSQLATVLVFFQYSRFRIAALLPLLAAGAGFVDALARRAREDRRRLVIAGVAGGGVLAAGFAPTSRDANEQLANGHVALADAYRTRGESGDLERALAEFARAEEIAPRLLRIPLLRTETLRAAGRAGEARDALEKVLSTAPDHPLLLETLARLLLDEPAVRDVERASALARHATEVAPELASARVTLARARFVAEDWDGAGAAGEEALRLAPRDAAANAVLGAALARRADLTRAEKLLRQALALDRGSAFARTELARLLAQTGRGAEAERVRSGR